MSVRIDAILFQSTDPEALARFYQNGFDLPAPTPQGDDHFGMPADNTYLGFDRIDASDPGSSVCIWFKVSDLEDRMARLQDLGATLETDPEVCPDETLVTLRDPENNLIGLIAPAR